jgi:aryl-alcohol dehydrogenase-like predicted oxidoreductase
VRFRSFGKAGFDVSEIGFGAWGIGGSWWGRSPDDAAALAALRAAVEHGVTFYDTARVYGDGHSERLVGQVRRENKDRDLFVASKIPPKNYRWPAARGSDVRDSFPADWIVSSTETSLKNLGLERIDVMQFHVWTDGWLAQSEEWLPAVERLKRDGKIRLWGVSINDHEPDTALELVRSGLADSVQVILNLFDQTPAERLLPLCREKNVAAIARVPFDEGSLTGAFTADTTFEEGDFRRNYFAGRMPEVLRRVDALRFLVGETGAETLAQAALKFCLSFSAISTVIPGMRKPSRVAENVRASDGRYFGADLLAKLKAHAWNRNFYGND